ncbi:MAG: NAD-dependent epimerase/dehydratase family protein [Polynucleobacter sp.]
MIVVTGAKGVIGSAVVAQLLARGIEVIAISREVFDLSKGNDLASYISKKPEVIIHLAAAVPHSARYPDTNESALLTRSIDNCVLNAVNKWNCRVIYASTCSLYDKRSNYVMFEDSPLLVRAESQYMKTKSEGEAIFAKSKSYAILRVPAPIGPGLPKSVVAKQFFDLATVHQSIRIWGSGKREQNYVDVGDIASAMINAAYSKVNGVFNIAANAPTTMISLAMTIVAVVGKGSIEFADNPDPLEYENARYSNRRAHDLLSWSPKISLKDSIKSMQEFK